MREPDVMILPNFFIVGAPKAGTDELYYDLDQHPDIYMSLLKEPCYFSSEIRLAFFESSLRQQAEKAAANTRKFLDEGMPNRRFGGIISDRSDYEKLFSRVRNEKAIGEGSVCYLWSNSAAAAIAAAVPHARIIIVLMDPSERAFHQYLKSVSDGTVGHDFHTHLKAALERGTELSVYHPFLEFGNYFEQVRRYLDHFPSEQIQISLYEDVCADRRMWFANVLEFLNVDKSFVPEEVEVPSQPHVPYFIGLSHALPIREIKRAIGRVIPKRFKKFAKRAISRKELPKLRAEDRATLVEYYREDILKLQGLIGRDLSAWLR